MFVVSDRGDILSPKYAPDIIAPPIKPIGSPIAVPIPSSAMPIVAIVLQELPVANETIAVMIAVANKNIRAGSSCRLEDFNFLRTGKVGITEYDFINYQNKEIKINMNINDILLNKYF